MEERKYGKLPSFLFGIYGCSGLIISLLRNGVWNETSGQGPTIAECLQLGSLFVFMLFVLLYLNVYLGTKLSSRYNNSDIVCGLISFFLYLALTEIALEPPISRRITWNTILEGVLPGGIIGWSHVLFIDFAKLREEWSDKVEHARLVKHWAGKNILSKALELEHSALQTALNWILWGSLVFLTAGVAAYFLQQMQDPTLGFRLTLAMPTVVWAIFGVCFGIVKPMNDTMKYIRQQLVLLSCLFTQDQEKGEISQK